MSGNNGELDDGELEPKADALDVAVKNHPRTSPPADLLDRCLSTIHAQTSACAGTAEPVAVPFVPVRRSRISWVALATAACLLFLVGSMILPNIQSAREAARRTVATNYLRQFGDAEAPTAPSGTGYSYENESVPSRDGQSKSDKVDSHDGTVATVIVDIDRGADAATADVVSGISPSPKGQIAGSLEPVGRKPRDSNGSGLSDRSLPAKNASRNPSEAKPAGQNDGKRKLESETARRSAESVPSTQPMPGGGKQDFFPGPSTKSVQDSKVEYDRLHEEAKQATAEALASRQVRVIPLNEEAKQATAEADARLRNAIDEANARRPESTEVREQLLKVEAKLKSFQTEQRNLDASAAYESLEKQAAALEGRAREINRLIREHEIRRVGPNTEAYAPVVDNPFLAVSKSPLSTFSTDVDTASYSNVRRFLNQGMLPPKDAVRIEELLNYFSYNYPSPDGPDPFSVNLDVAGCPWNGEHRLVRVGLKGREVANARRPPANIVFLIDVSGSMQPANKLPLLKSSLKMLMQRLGENERVAIVTYSHEIKLVLPSTTCESRETINAAIDSLQAAGSTNGAGGLQLAYHCAVENFIAGGINRVILATDGDFNVGITDPAELQRFIEQKAKTGVFLSVLGFGYGNLKDATLERLADKGNGHFAYIDNLDEAKKVLVDQLSGTLLTIAKDVKLQIEFNPATVSAYRLIGYENRILAAQDFNDDRKDAGDVGAGHTVTALYEIVPVGKPIALPGQPGVDPLKYQPPPRDELPARERLDEREKPLAGPVSREMLTVKLRYKLPDADQSKLFEVAVTDSGRGFGEATTDTKFAAAVAAFGMILRDSPHRGTATLDAVLEIADDARGTDRDGYRAEFSKLVRLAKTISGR